MTPIIDRIRCEFIEMPGMRLTARQVQRLCGLDPIACAAVLDALVQAGFLFAASDGTYSRVGEGSDIHARMARASLRVVATHSKAS